MLGYGHHSLSLTNNKWHVVGDEREIVGIVRRQ